MSEEGDDVGKADNNEVDTLCEGLVADVGFDEWGKDVVDLGGEEAGCCRSVLAFVHDMMGLGWLEAVMPEREKIS